MNRPQEDNKARIERLKQIVLAMPEKPGSYQYYDADGIIIYVGKAKNLKKRVSSYFHKEVDRFKTKVLVSKIHDITYTVVNTEEDALLLENALIKKYNPKYNILLKDGKTYPSIVITNELFPRIFQTRRINKLTGTYFGPYSHLASMYTILDLIRKLYHPRTCNLPLNRDNIDSGKYKPCLKYHLGNCGAPCAGKQSYEDYLENIRSAREILRGNTRHLSGLIYDKMLKKAEELKFEEAEELKQKYLLIEQFCAKSEVVSFTIDAVDVFSIDDDENRTNAYINYMHVKNGAINQSFTYEYKRKLQESDAELLLQAVLEIRERFHSTAKEIIVPFEMEWTVPGASFFVPQRGDKKHLVELSLMNCKQYRIDRLKQSDKLNPEQKSVRLMKELQEKLGLPKLPYHIEAFDNSNISGSDAVAGCVVFKGMKPSKKDYRTYNIKTVVGPDDYASMQEVVYRRYSRLMQEEKEGGKAVMEAEKATIETASEERLQGTLQEVNVTKESSPKGELRGASGGTSFPDLIVCDGGIGQMNCVRKVIEEDLGLSIPIAGLAKDDKHRTNELLFIPLLDPNDPLKERHPVTIQIKPTSELFHVLTQLQDEVHRFAITFHRNKRSKHALHSELDDIKGIGPKTKDALMKHFKSVRRIKEATLEELSSAVGNGKGGVVFRHFHGEFQMKNEE